MGKLVLFLVLAFALGGAMLSASHNALGLEGTRGRRAAQGNLLARDISSTAQSMIVNAMLDDDGFQPSLNISELEYAGGRADIEYTVSPERDTADVVVTSLEGGSVHRVHSRYAWDDVDFPSPVWLDVPYATGSFHRNTQINGGTEALNVAFDRRKFDDLRLGNLVNLTNMRTALSTQVAGTSGSTRGVSVPLDWDRVLEDLNVEDAEELYYTALNAMNATDVTLTGAQTITNTRTYGTAGSPKIVHVNGNLTVNSGGRITGTGALIVTGTFAVNTGGVLDWDGLVIIHSEADYLPIVLNGTVTVDGALVVDQQGAPPGGHLDVTVLRDLAGTWAQPYGNRTGSPWTVYGNFPWFQHTHRFDLTPSTAPRGKKVFFRRYNNTTWTNSANWPHEVETSLLSTLQGIGTTQQVYLEFARPEMHGLARWDLNINGQPNRFGMVRNGFGDFAAGPSTPHRSQPFRVDQLKDLSVDIRSLRMLQPLFDESGCREWPHCVGNDRNRSGALTLRVKRADNHRTMYEAAMYWHLRPDEVNAHLEEERAWRLRIESGQAFGTRLTTGANVRLNYAMEPIRLIGQRLNFDGQEIHNVGQWAQHWDAREIGGGYAGGSNPDNGDGTVTICHTRGRGSSGTMTAQLHALPSHLAHGDYLGACRAGGGRGGSGGSGG
ncbi:MAG TPA: hypothetical protein VD962_04340 [Rubricoccaceae bacterium]|nr:hypothetical protein [Rubricoccaceae bacterium]